MSTYQNPSERCRVYTIEASSCDCLLILSSPGAKDKRIPLQDAFTYEFSGGFVIQGKSTGVKVSDASAFTQTDIDVLICACTTSIGGGAPATNTNVGRVLLTGADSWVAPAGLQSMAYQVRASGDEDVTPTITTISGTLPLFADEVGGYSVTKDSDIEIIAPLTITTSLGDIVVITYTL